MHWGDESSSSSSSSRAGEQVVAPPLQQVMNGWTIQKEESGKGRDGHDGGEWMNNERNGMGGLLDTILGCEWGDQ
uniref:Uncharacterized protein n=1 Tax=Globodera rostochiensis TaxID=31243 RepID=A0A914HEX2_GLORO